VRPNNSLITHNGEAQSFFTDVFEQYLKSGVVPITCGDVIMDTAKGCTIWSTEEVLSFFAHQFQAHGWEVQNVIHVTDVPGVMDEQGKTIERITQKDWVVVEKALGQTKGFDVTGGMVLKLQQSLLLADAGITSFILSGLEENNLRAALSAEPWVGTTVTQ
jgi:isopentenyl phosphate kinase